MSSTQTPIVDDGDDDGKSGEQADGDEGTESSGMFDSVPSLGLSRRHLLILGVVVAVAIAWRLRQSSNSSGGQSAAAQEVAEARDAEIGDVTVTEEEGAENVEVVVPADPDDELEKDEAVVEMLREAGHIEGDE